MCHPVTTEPGERVAFTWTQVGWPGGIHTVVTVSFTPLGDGTRVTLSHDGFAALDADADRYRDGYVGGWPTVLDWFAGHANRSPRPDKDKEPTP